MLRVIFFYGKKLKVTHVIFVGSEDSLAASVPAPALRPSFELRNILAFCYYTYQSHHFFGI